METNKAPDKKKKQQEYVISEAYNIITNSKYPKEIREFASNAILAFAHKKNVENRKSKLKIKCFYRREDSRIIEINDVFLLTNYRSIKHKDRPYRIEIPKEIEFKSYEYNMISSLLDINRSIDGEGVYYEQYNS